MLTNTDGSLRKAAPTFHGSLIRSGSGQGDKDIARLTVYILGSSKFTRVRVNCLRACVCNIELTHALYTSSYTVYIKYCYWTNIRLSCFLIASWKLDTSSFISAHSLLFHTPYASGRSTWRVSSLQQKTQILANTQLCEKSH